jgi:hypothetical protein
VRNPRTPVFLNWVADRFVNIHDESENVDFVMRLRHEARKAQTLMANLSANHHTYQLFMTGEEPVGDGELGDYVLKSRGSDQIVKSHLQLTSQQAGDLARQLDACIDYFND